jgi:hypothetical protein
MKKKNAIWIFSVMIVAFVLMFLLTNSCNKVDEPFRMDLLTSRSWSLNMDNTSFYTGDEYCVFAFKTDGTLMNYNFTKSYSSWRFREDDWILTLDYDDYKVLKISENELIIKYNTDLLRSRTAKI